MPGKKFTQTFLFLLLPFILAACSIPLTANAGIVISLATFTAESDGASLEETATATLDLTSTPVPTGTNTATPTPTMTQTTTNTPTGTSTQVAEACNLAEFVSDVNYPDGSTVYAGSSFEKTWRLRNIGSCTWTTDYTVVFNSGYRMSAPYSITFTSVDILPGETVDITLSFISPETAGYYQGSFYLRSPDGETFGVGSTGTTAFWVKIYSANYYSVATSTPVTPEPDRRRPDDRNRHQIRPPVTEPNVPTDPDNPRPPNRGPKNPMPTPQPTLEPTIEPTATTE